MLPAHIILLIYIIWEAYPAIKKSSSQQHKSHLHPHNSGDIQRKNITDKADIVKFKCTVTKMTHAKSLFKILVFKQG